MSETTIIKQKENSKFPRPWKEMYSFFMALLPVISIYRVPFTSFGLGILVLLSFLPYVSVNIRTIDKSTLITSGFILYLLIRSLGDEQGMILLLIMWIHYLGAANGLLDIKVVKRTIVSIAIISSIIILVQSVIFYLFRYRISFLIGNLLIDEHQAVPMQFANSVGLFRPSALFLEPAHYAQYCCIALVISMFSYEIKKRKLKVFLISAGIVLTTSGQGIALVLCIAYFFLLFSGRETFKKARKRLGWTMVILLSGLVMLQIPFFQEAVQRVLGYDSTGYNAVLGRTLFWNDTVGGLRGMDLILGLGPLARQKQKYMTGLMVMVFCYGCIGYISMVVSFLSTAVAKLNKIAICLAIIYCGLTLIANLTGTISMTFWLCIVVAFSKSMNEKQVHNT